MVVYGHTPDAVLQAIPGLSFTWGMCSCDQIGKIKVHRFMVYGNTPTPY